MRLPCARIILLALLLSTVPANQPADNLRAAEQSSTSYQAGPVPLKAYALRLHPGQDLKKELDSFVQRHSLRGACPVTCAGSLTSVFIRFANNNGATLLKGHFEILSLTGTLSSTGGSHLHITIADENGKTYGGHLMEGSSIYTTAEIVLGILEGATFVREKDEESGYDELRFK